MTSYFSYRAKIRVVFGILFLLIVFLANVYFYWITNASPTIFLTLLIPALNLLNDFAPGIYSFLIAGTSRSENAAFIEKCEIEFVKFMQEFFSLEILLKNKKRSLLPLATQLESLVNKLPFPALGKSEQADKRRRPLAVMLFLVKYNEILKIDSYEPIFSYVKTRFRALTDAGKKEFIFSYFQAIINGKKFLNVDSYFSAIKSKDYQLARLHFYDRYLKDDYIDEITRIMQLKESQIDSFKKSLEAVAKSGTLNLSYLKRFINDRKKYRRLFIVTSDTKLPKIIQAYITQNPHFILNWASITNLPKVGLSKRFDIFFFSPDSPITSAQALLNEFIKIDGDVISHPLKIYAVDPAEGVSASLERNSEFSQSIKYFENSTFNTSVFDNLNYDQLMSLLEQSKISLKDLIAEVPVVEFSNEISSIEKPFLNKFLGQFTAKAGKYSIFHLVTKKKKVLSLLSNLKQIPKDLSNTDLQQIITGKITLAKFKIRIKSVASEICENIIALDKTLV